MKSGTAGDQRVMKRLLSTAVSLAISSALIAACTSEGIHTVGELPGSGENTGGLESSGDSSSAHSNGQDAAGGGWIGGIGASAGSPSSGTGGDSQEGGAGGAPPGADDCALQQVRTTPTNGCEAIYHCDGRVAFNVMCLGETEDDTSLCSCRAGAISWNIGPIPGEGTESCLAVAPACADTMPESVLLEAEQPAAIDACVSQSITVIPSEYSPTDHCEGTYLCDTQTFTVRCSSELDGTNTSLCDCSFGGKSWGIYGEWGLFQGEGPDSCIAAAAECAEVMKEQNER